MVKTGNVVYTTHNETILGPEAGEPGSNRCVLTAQVKAGEPRRLTEGYLANVDGSGSKLANVWVGVAGEQINKQKIDPPYIWRRAPHTCIVIYIFSFF